MAKKEVGDSAYVNIIQTVGLKPLGYQDVANDWEENVSESYHGLL